MDLREKVQKALDRYRGVEIEYPRRNRDNDMNANTFEEDIALALSGEPVSDHEILAEKAYYVRARLKELTDWLDDEVMPRIKDMPRPAPAANTEGRGLREALAGLARGTDGDGQVCFCEVAIGNPMMHGDHSAACRKARADLRGDTK